MRILRVVIFLFEFSMKLILGGRSSAGCGLIIGAVLVSVRMYIDCGLWLYTTLWV